MKNIESLLNYADTVADWFTSLGLKCVERGDLEAALKYAHVAGGVLIRQNRRLCDRRLEDLVLRVAALIPIGGAMAVGGEGEKACLHVLTEALPAGGLTAMAVRWMESDPSGRPHSVALLQQGTSVPESLIEVVERKGGKVHSAAAELGVLGRAVWLRRLSMECASHVVLHVDPADVITGAAYGISGGAPVMQVNHAAHTFSMGVSITDLLLNCRGSEQEASWAKRHRGMPRFATVPIPLPEDSVQTVEYRDQARSGVRNRLGIAPDALVLLSVGSHFKYLPIVGVDFLKMSEQLLTELPDAVLLIVGFHGDERWAAASARVGRRISTLGRMTQVELAEVRAASDLYLEGFPFGTTTSLLEAAVSGMPVVLSPATSPPPYGSDGVALDGLLERPANVDEFVATVVRLARSPGERARFAETVQKSVRRYHMGDGWREHLRDALAVLPVSHGIYEPEFTEPTPKEIYEHWARFLPQWNVPYEECLEQAILSAVSMGLMPKLDDGIRLACANAAAVRSGSAVPIPLLSFVLASGLSGKAVAVVLRFLGFAYRGSLSSRLRYRIARALRLRERKRGQYDEYR